MFPSQKKLLVNTNFVKMMLHVNKVHEKLWGIHVSGDNGQNGDIIFKSFYIGNEVFHKSSFCY